MLITFANYSILNKYNTQVWDNTGSIQYKILCVAVELTAFVI